MSWQVEKFESLDELIELYLIVYPDKDASKFNWLYLDNPCGHGEMFGVRDPATGRLIGAYCYIPMLFEIDGKEVPVAQAIDGVVHPDYRGQRVFNAITAFTTSFFGDRYHYLFCFANYKTANSWLRFDWQIVGDFHIWSLPLGAGALPSSLTGKPLIGHLAKWLAQPLIKAYTGYKSSRYLLPDTTLTEMKEVPINIDQIAAAVRKQNPAGIKRDKAYIKWRLMDIPRDNYLNLVYSRSGQQLGYIGCMRHGKTTVMTDFLVSPEIENLQAAVSLLIKHCSLMGFEAIHYQVAGQPYCAEALKSLGFIKRSSIDSIFLYPTSKDRPVIKESDCIITVADTDWI